MPRRWRGALTVALAAVIAPAAPAAAQEFVAITMPDGAPVLADAYGAGGHAVVLAPGGRFDRASWAPQARALAAAGFRVLAIDFRASVRSRNGGASSCLYDAVCLARDVLAAVRYLRRTGATTVSVVGGSLGGGAAAQATVDGDPGEIDRVVLLAHMAIETPERMRGRKLFIVTRDDPGPDGTPRLRRIRDQYERAPDPKTLVILDGAAHAQFIFATAQGERLLDDVLEFLRAP